MPSSVGAYSRFSRAQVSRSGAHSTKASGRTRRIWPKVVAGIVGFLAALLIVVGAFGFGLLRSVQRVQDQAAQAMSVIDELQVAIQAGDKSGLPDAAASLSDAVHAVNEEVSGLNWQVASHMPVYGQDIKSVQVLGGVLVDLADNALTPASSALMGMDLTAILQSGSINAAVVSQLADMAQDVAPVISRCTVALEELPAAHISQVSDILGQITGSLSTANTLLSQINNILPYLPQILGVDGQTRTYLVIAQNNSELRATGGYAGAWGVISVTDGNVSLGDFTSLAGLRGVTFDVTEEERVLFGEGMAQAPTNLNMTPDFARAGSLLAGAWTAYTGQTVDGVIAMDPVFLQSDTGIDGRVCHGWWGYRRWQYHCRGPSERYLLVVP